MPDFRHSQRLAEVAVKLKPTAIAANHGYLAAACSLRIGMRVAHNSDTAGVSASPGRCERGRSVACFPIAGRCCKSGLGTKARVEVLRISVQEKDGDLSLVLEGRLVGPWVDELQRVCGDLGAPANYAKMTVDLCGVTAMDPSGQALLDRLLQRGATLRCSDVMNQYWVEQMAQSAKRLPEACRPCRSHISGSPDETALASS